MEELMLLTCMTVFTLLAGLCSIVFNKVKLPPLIGYLVAGIIIANYWTVGPEAETVVGVLSDIGLVMLMFCIGLEVNLKKIRRQGIFAIKVAAIQLPLMVVGGMIAGGFLGFNMVQCIALGCIISGSSTAVVMAVLKSNGKLNQSHIELLVLITIMEDIGQVIMLSMITPVLKGSSMSPNELIVMIISIIVFMVISLIVGLRLIPRIVNWISDNVTDEVLVIFSVGLAFGMAFLSVKVGLSMAIGAFLMGMMMSTCRKSKEINHQIEPMKNMFMAMFFISVGMEISINLLISNIALVIIFYLLFATLKTSTVFLGYWVCNEDGKMGFISALSLTAMGEFAFIIAKEALDYGVVDNSFYTSVIGAALISMIMLPLLTKSCDKVWDKASEKCPASISTRITKINDARDNLYSTIYDMSKKSQRSIRKSMTHAYINVLVMIIIEIVFIYGFEPAGRWLSEFFGYDVWYWYIGILLVNFFVLCIPTLRLVNNIKLLDSFVIDSARHISQMEIGDDSGRVFQRFLKINAYLVTVGIDFIILMIVPNPLGLWEHFLILAIAIITLAVAIVKSKKNENRADEDQENGLEEIKTDNQDNATTLPEKTDSPGFPEDHEGKDGRE